MDGEPGQEVQGFAVKVESIEHEYKLAYYEMSAYELAPFKIYFLDGEEPKNSRERRPCTPEMPRP